MDVREKLVELVHNARMNALWHNAQKPDEYITDMLMEDGVTVQGDKDINVWNKMTPPADTSSTGAEILDCYIPCRTCGKLIPAGGNNHCLTCRVWLLRLEETMPKWISVKDRLPEKDGHYLCNYHFGEYPKMTFTQVLDYYATYIVPHFQHTLGDGSMKVTHWMEIPKLPQPPKVE